MIVNHVLTQASWDLAREAGVHAPPELARDGFLHCCLPAQIGFVLQKHFAGVTDLLVMAFESDEVPALLRFVKSEPDHAPFPHLYGPIPLGAVRGIEPA